jgi:hypothetical protein
MIDLVAPRTLYAPTEGNLETIRRAATDAARESDPLCLPHLTVEDVAAMTLLRSSREAGQIPGPRQSRQTST